MKKASTSILTFPLRTPGTGDDADPRWQRVEALTREIAALEPRFGQHLAQRLEQTFAALIPYLIETLDLDHRAEMMTMTHRAEIDRVETYRREALERLAQGRPIRGDTFWAEEAPASDRLDDLVIRLLQAVRGYRRGRPDCYEQRSEPRDAMRAALTRRVPEGGGR